MGEESHKERVRRAFERRPVDRLPTQINCTRAMCSRLAATLGVPIDELSAQMDNHLLRVDLSYTQRDSPDGRVSYDWWGAGWDTAQEGYFLADAPLAGAALLKDFDWPDPMSAGLLGDAESAVAQDGGRHFVVPNFGFCLFERAWSLVGYTQLLTLLLLKPNYVAELLDRITEIQIVLAQRFVELGVDGGYFGDDYGAQSNLLFSPRLWRELFKPRLACLFSVFRERDLPVILHSDGQIEAILPDLVEIGVTVLNPVQPEVLDHERLSRAYGDRLAFYGGISTQTVLPYGTPVDVHRAVEECIRNLASDGTGLLLAPSHRLMADIPASNLEALLGAFRELAGI